MSSFCLSLQHPAYFYQSALGSLGLNILCIVLSKSIQSSYISVQVAPAQGSQSGHCLHPHTWDAAKVRGAGICERLNSAPFCSLSSPVLLLPPKLCFCLPPLSALLSALIISSLPASLLVSFHCILHRDAHPNPFSQSPRKPVRFEYRKQVQTSIYFF